MSEGDACLYVRPLPDESERDVIEQMFGKFGEIANIRILQGYGFVYYKDRESAERAHETLNNTPFRNKTLTVDFSHAKPSKPTRDYRRDDGYDREERVPGPRYRAIVSNLTSSTSWQDLKDFARSAGVTVLYSDVSRSRDGTGVLEFASAEELDMAIRKLDGTDFQNGIVTVREDDRPPPPPRSYDRGGFRGRGPPPYGRGRGRGRGGYRGYDRYDRGGYDDRYSRDRYDRYRGDYDRRGGGFDRRRRDYDDRGGRYDRRDYDDRYDRGRDYDDRRRGDYDAPRDDYDAGRDRRDYADADRRSVSPAGRRYSDVEPRDNYDARPPSADGYRDDGPPPSAAAPPAAAPPAAASAEPPASASNGGEQQEGGTW